MSRFSAADFEHAGWNAGSANGDDGILTAIAAARARGEIATTAQPPDIMAMVIAMPMAWSPVSKRLAASAAEAKIKHRRRRAFLRDTHRRALDTSDT